MGFLAPIGAFFAGSGAAASGAAAGAGLAGTITGATIAAVPAAAAAGGAIGVGAGLTGLAAGATTLAAMTAPAVAGAAAGAFWANAANIVSTVGTGYSLFSGMFSQQQGQEGYPQDLQMPELQPLPEEPDPRKAALEAQAQEREAYKRRVSFKNTLLTGPRGLLETAPVGYKTLMGN